jgi:hypothetical protein
MPQRIVRRAKNWKFTHAAAAMGAFWERAREIESRRILELRQALLQRTKAVAGGSVSSVAVASQR